MRYLILLGLAALFVVPAAAHTDHGTFEPNITVEGMLDHPDELATLYNGNADRVPGLVRSLVADERINVHIALDGENRTVGIVMDGIRIDTMAEGGVENATLELYTDRDTVEEIAAAERPPRAVVDALNDGRIRYEATGLWKTVAFGIVTALLKAFGGFM